MPAPADSKPITWPSGLYRLVELGEGPPGALATCARHQGQHVYYLDGCHSLPPHDPRYRDRTPRREPEPVLRVEITNLDDLAEVLGSLALRFSREHGERGLHLASEPRPLTPAAPDVPPSAPNDMPTIPVWTPDDSPE